jgi:hypothetical protein
MSRTLLAFATLSLAAMPGADPARAQIDEHVYQWCAELGGREGGGTNCGFVTLAQCRATISGIGGRCYVNPQWPPPRATEGRSRRKPERY